MRTIARSVRSLRRYTLAAALVSAGAALAACGGDKTTSPTPVATTLDIMSGDNQTTTPNTAIAAPLVVEVLDQNNAVLPSQAITWAIASGTGTLSATSSTTDSNGQASVIFTPDANVGTASITATVGTLNPVTFTVTVAAAAS